MSQIKAAEPSQTVSWPRKIVLVLAILVGGSTLVTTALAAAVGHHAALHAQFCQEIDHSANLELFVRAALGFVALDPS
ncbi:hypothetical protein [Rhizobium halophilum]|uniref:hypothetical protein n=1 Tax=Rhizobium halophilum TaxID=2846852 RepID=UPI001EFE0B9A|nr:hypothetical protein [Rhizobium halophilum]MCF6370687.1 hypothetical protein [Rhizobium halophilum]